LLGCNRTARAESFAAHPVRVLMLKHEAIFCVSCDFWPFSVSFGHYTG
jgi:hypothetical protein